VRLVVIAILKRNPVVNDPEVLMTVKELSELLRVQPVHALQAAQAG
jgi:hypothetical protein